MAKWYQVTPKVLINLDDVSNIALNEDGERGWVRMKTTVGPAQKTVVFPITKEQFDELRDILIPPKERWT